MRLRLVYGGHDQAAIRDFREGSQLGVPDLTDPTGELARQVGAGGRHQVLFVSASRGVIASLSAPFNSNLSNDIGVGARAEGMGRTNSEGHHP